MASRVFLREGFLLLAVFQMVLSSGSYPPKKIQIQVPHNIQHHHHTHTKYHFITVPIIRTLNDTTTTTARPPMVVLPVMPMIPGLMANATPTQPPAPVAPPMQPLQPQQPFNPIPAMYYNGDYELIDMFNRRRGEKYVRAESTQPPMKFRTIINVQETKKIPLSELLNLNNLLKKEPPRRIKVEVIPDKTSYVKPSQTVDWSALQEKLRLENLEYDADTAAYQSRMEQVVEKPEWAAVKHLLEKHIKEDFPGLNIQAEIKQVGASDRADPRVSQMDTMDLKHIGYVVIDEKDQQHFVGLSNPVPDPTT